MLEREVRVLGQKRGAQDKRLRLRGLEAKLEQVVAKLNASVKEKTCPCK